MKQKHFELIKTSFRIFCTTIAFGFLVALTSCDDEDPVKENVPELITKVILTFTPPGAGAGIVVTATDPDGEGVQDLIVDGPINLGIATTYSLKIDLVNGLASPTSAAYDIDVEVQEEADEHMFFFAWTDDLFEDPSGNGNVDSRSDDVNYSDEDSQGRPLGLTTTWRSVPAAATGTFKVILKHQPALKSGISTSADGETDLDITFNVNVQ